MTDGQSAQFFLLTVKFNDQLLIDRQLNIFALGQRKHFRRVSVAIYFQPVGLRAMAGEFLGHFQDHKLLALFANGNFFARAHLVRRNVHFAIVDRNVPMANQLPRLAPRLREAQTENNVIETPLELLQKQFAGHALRSRSFFEVVAELAFQREVNTLGFLLLTQLQTVTNDFGLTVLPMLSGSEFALLDITLIAETL